MADTHRDKTGPMAVGASPPRPWRDLTEAEQTALQIAYQDALDKEPPTCSLDTKIERFSRWLAGRGVSFSQDDLAGD